MITEGQLEQLCVDWFQSIGHIFAYDIATYSDKPERNDHHLHQIKRI